MSLLGICWQRNRALGRSKIQQSDYQSHRTYSQRIRQRGDRLPVRLMPRACHASPKSIVLQMLLQVFQEWKRDGLTSRRFASENVALEKGKDTYS
jgi:hypothetical protein